jgi:hypothetical protein
MIARDLGLSECGCVMNRLDRQARDQDDDPKRAVGFAATVVLPGEDQKEFDCLLDDLRCQYEPEGRLEEDAVKTIANAIWRKGHLDVFNRAFVARTKWGSYFNYPGDPDGFTRMFQEHRQHIKLTHVESMTSWATHMVKGRLAKIDAVGLADKTSDNAEGKAAESLAKKGAVKIKTNEADHAADEFIPEGILRKVVDSAVSEIREDNDSDAGNPPMRAEFIAGVVNRIVEREIEAENTEAKCEKRPSSREEIARTKSQFAKLLEALETALGRGFVEELVEKINNDRTEHALARFGDLLTPEFCVSELRFAELLDLTIERAHNRLIKYQAARAKKTASDIVSLQPGWAARKR